jgi:LPS-assembly lipoprotein
MGMVNWRGKVRLSGLIMAIAMVGLMAGCGFSPIYERDGDGLSADIARELASVDVLPISDRVGRQLRLKLRQDLAVAGSSVDPKYALKVELTASRTSLLIQADDTITRFNLRLDAAFVLVDVAADENVFRGNAQSIGSYNVVESEFATVAAERDSEDRAAGELGAEIHSLLVTFFSRVRS